MAKLKAGKERGKFLTIMMVVIGLFMVMNILGIIIGGKEYLNLPENSSGLVNVLIIIVLNLVEIISFIGIIKWKKSGAWAFLGVMIFSIIFAQFYSVTPPGVDKNYMMAMWLPPLVIYGLLYWAIYRQWKYFE
jgi:hypothetical protein